VGIPEASDGVAREVMKRGGIFGSW
jgi:hypothetical protein